MYKELEYSDGRVHIEGGLTIGEVKELALNRQLKVLQFSEAIDDKSFELLDNQFFTYRDDVELRVFGYHGQICDLSFLTRMPNLKKFSADCLAKVRNLESLSQLSKLKQLTIGVSHLQNLDFMKSLPRTLESLSIGSTLSRNLNLRDLSLFRQLKTLTIDGHTNGLEVLSELSDLEGITLRSLVMDNFHDIASLPRVNSLILKDCAIQEFDAIRGMNQLTHLELWKVRGLTDLSFISSLHGLHYLFLHDLPKVKKLPCFQSLSCLKKIVLEQMKGLTDVTALERASSLEEFTFWSVSNQRVQDFIPLLRNPAVKRVSVDFGSGKENYEFKELAESMGKVPAGVLSDPLVGCS